MDLDEYNPAALVPSDPSFSREAAAVFRMLREVVGPACSEAAAASMVTRAVYWKQRNGLTVDDLRAAARYLSRPETLARITHQGELMAEFASAVGRAFADRRRREETARLRAGDAAAAAGAARSEEVRALVGKLLSGWGNA